jgi:cellulose synthase/poly-beta-1,6-N-acetylglucosamine synthase-like glycosyltransferase
VTQPARPAVSVVVPFLGDADDAQRLRANLLTLSLGPEDELVVADNTAGGVAREIAGGQIRVVLASAERSSYHARNAGAREATGEWLLFMDADCTPIPDLLDEYFRAPVPSGCGALAGGIAGDPGQGSFIARYTRDRKFFDQTEGLHGQRQNGAATGNLMVRRTAFDSIGGFCEGIRSAGDVDLSWRLQGAGWTLEYRPTALVAHRHREGLASLLGAIARYGAGASWLNERYPGAAPRWPLVPGLRGTAVDMVKLTARGRFEPALYRGVDGLGLVAHNIGYVSSNRAA